MFMDVNIRLSFGLMGIIPLAENLSVLFDLIRSIFVSLKEILLPLFARKFWSLSLASSQSFHALTTCYPFKFDCEFSHNNDSE
jgi:hypothetical protein